VNIGISSGTSLLTISVIMYLLQKNIQRIYIMKPTLPDITSAKVGIPAALFLALSPGFLLSTDGKKVSFEKNLTGRSYVLFHSLVFFLAFALIAKQLKIILTKTDLIVTTLLFIALSPGMLLTIPSEKGGFFKPDGTSFSSQLVHTLVFALVFAILRKQFPQFY